MEYSKVRKAAQEDFEKAFKATGLNGYPSRGGYTVTGWGNEGRNIRETLESAGLPYERNLSGTFIVNSWPFEQAALQKAVGIAPAP